MARRICGGQTEPVTAPSFLIDECLSRTLCDVAYERGYAAQALVDLGKAGTTDWDVMRIVDERDVVLVTNNVIDFLALYRFRPLHPGVAFQSQAFAAALDDIDANPDIVNLAIEVTPGVAPQWLVQRYPLPKP